jgi:hypothetical protein
MKIAGNLKTNSKAFNQAPNDDDGFVPIAHALGSVCAGVVDARSEKATQPR